MLGHQPENQSQQHLCSCACTCHLYHGISVGMYSESRDKSHAHALIIVLLRLQDLGRWALSSCSHRVAVGGHLLCANLPVYHSNYFSTPVVSQITCFLCYSELVWLAFAVLCFPAAMFGQIMVVQNHSLHVAVTHHGSLSQFGPTILPAAISN